MGPLRARIAIQALPLTGSHGHTYRLTPFPGFSLFYQALLSDSLYHTIRALPGGRFYCARGTLGFSVCPHLRPRPLFLGRGILLAGRGCRSPLFFYYLFRYRAPGIYYPPGLPRQSRGLSTRLLPLGLSLELSFPSTFLFSQGVILSRERPVLDGDCSPLLRRGPRPPECGEVEIAASLCGMGPQFPHPSRSAFLLLASAVNSRTVFFFVFFCFNSFSYSRS